MCYYFVMKMHKTHRKFHTILISIEAIITVGLLLGVGVIFLNTNSLIAKLQEPNVIPEIQLPEVTEASSRLLFTGTTFWGRNIRNMGAESGLNEKYAFVNFGSFEREKYQAWFGNLECPVTNKEHTNAEEFNLLSFNCLDTYLPEVAKYWTAFSLGTNHNDNWGDWGIAETKTNLKNAGIQYFGSHLYNDGENNCNIVVIPVSAKLSNDTDYEFKMPLGLCSAHGVFGIPTENALQNIKTYASLVPTIVMPHMGVEYQNSADQIRMNLYRKMIDYGADMVLADHPHHVQNSESYQGHLIVYSMGNFMFDQLFDETPYSAAIDVTAKYNTDMDFDAWTEISEICLENDGNCLNNIAESGLPRINLTWTNYDFIATTSKNNRQPRVGDESDRNFVGNRLNWNTVVNNLGF